MARKPDEIESVVDALVSEQQDVSRYKRDDESNLDAARRYITGAVALIQAAEEEETLENLDSAEDDLRKARELVLAEIGKITSEEP